MQTWEYATLGWYVDEVRQRAVHYWQPAGEDPDNLDPVAYRSRLVEAGREGWELVSVAAMFAMGETMYFKRAVPK